MKDLIRSPAYGGYQSIGTRKKHPVSGHRYDDDEEDQCPGEY